MLSDARRFFLKLGVWQAFNSDAGDVAQMLLLRADDKYDFTPPQVAGMGKRRILQPGQARSSVGGALLYWYVREIPN